ncbi:MAG: trypsin-like peptidase domain-containing protein [Firmicutes bacterium]|nr:trypsin-like peptidase domain-containing protein [Bacillota bacterium]
MKKHSVTAVIALMLVALMLMSTGCSFKDMISSPGETETSELPAENNDTSESAEDGQSPAGTTETDSSGGTETAQPVRESFADTIDAIKDSVVAINVYGTAYDYFYREYPTEGAGSGVIISPDGYIVTNNHVVTGGNSITVFLQDGTDYPARVVGSDETGDLAVLKIDAKGLTAAKIGNSSTLRVGDVAIAVGNPLGELQGTVTKGIISALDRELTIDNRTMTLLQTDAAINPGNSGGGLFDSNGTLIGIVCAKSSSGNAEGLGFVIPIDIAKPIFDDLIDYGYVTGRPTLGLTTVDISNNISAWQNGVDWIGVYVSEVTEDGPADAAGIKRVDYIHMVDGKVISSTSELEAAVSAKSVGDRVELEIWRGSSRMTVTVTLGEDNNAATRS